MTRGLGIRFSFLFFMQYALNAALFPILALYLREYLGFSGFQIGAILATASVSALVSPLAGAILADTYLSAESFFCICHGSAAIILFILSYTRSFPLFLGLYFLFGLFFGPTPALANAIVFHHIPEGENRFGDMRLWGTVGWIVVSLGFSFFWLRKGGALRGAMVLAAFIAASLAVFAFLALPRGERRAAGRVTLFPVEALKVFARRDILLLSVATLLYVLGEKIYYFGAAMYLHSLGLEEAGIMPFMSIAQITEVIAMITLSSLLRRRHTRQILRMGLFFLMLKFLFLALGSSLGLSIVAVACHGPAFAFFMIPAFIYLDKYCEKKYRTGAHQVFNFLEAGAGNLLGNLGAGLLMDQVTLSEGVVRFSFYWMVPAILSVIVFFLILFFFPSSSPSDSRGSN